MNSLRINQARLLQNLADLAAIGGTADGGVNRPAFSELDIAGRQWLLDQMLAIGLEVSVDGAGNQSGVYGTGQGRRRILVGSHLDTVPNGGRYDGALGILAALEAIQTIQEAGLTLPFDLELINFTDEEGTTLGEFGSQAFVGALTAEKLANPRGGFERLRDGMTRLGLTDSGCLGCRRSVDQYEAFVELHIEQGSRLEKSGIQIGVVTGIVGIRSFWLTFIGEAAHAGTKPMAERRDAFWGAADFAAAARRLAQGRFAPGVVNCGLIDLAPGAFNIVPAQAQLALEFRHGSEDLLDEFEAALLVLARQTAAAHNLDLTLQRLDEVRAAPSSEKVMQAIEMAAERLELSHTRLLSFAGHDTQAISPFIPSAMLFVPSVDGISHNPREFTHPHDCVNGANVVLQTLLVMGGG